MTIANATVIVTDNRDATADDAKSLGRIYRRLDAAIKAHKKATREVADAWVGGDRESLRFARDEAQHRLDDLMDESWDLLNDLPAGTVAPGGATPQTVGMQMFNRNLNRSLKQRLSSTEARAANKRSFA